MRGLAQIGDTPHSWPPDGKMMIYNPFKIVGNPFWDERIHRCLLSQNIHRYNMHIYIWMIHPVYVCAVYPYSWWCDSNKTVYRVYIVLHGICMFDLLLLLCSACRNTHVMVASELMGKNKDSGDTNLGRFTEETSRKSSWDSSEGKLSMYIPGPTQQHWFTIHGDKIPINWGTTTRHRRYHQCKVHHQTLPSGNLTIENSQDDSQ